MAPDRWRRALESHASHRALVRRKGARKAGLSWLLTSLLLLAGSLQPAAQAKGEKPTVCCRVAGGTRGTCLNQWLHLVPPGNRINPGSRRTLALLQGVPPQTPDGAPEATAMSLQFTTESAEVMARHTLPAAGPGIWLLTLPADWLPLRQPLIWESFPSCQPNRPPTRTLLVADQDGEQAATQQFLIELARSCGSRIDTQPLLRRFDLQETGERFRLPAQLPVRCLSLERPGLNGDPGRPTNP